MIWISAPLSSLCLYSYISLLRVGEVKKTVFLVGKGITYDTGGADIKAGGHMAGMSRYVLLDQRVLNNLLRAKVRVSCGH